MNAALHIPSGENKCPRHAFRHDGDEMGCGSSPLSLSLADIRRTYGCRLPDAILHGWRSCRPRSRAVQNLAATGLLSEASKPTSADGCATGRRTRSRHACDFSSRLDRIVQGRPSLLAVRWPRTTGLTSYLSGCFILTNRRYPFYRIAGIRKVFTSLAMASCPPRFARSLCPAFRRLSFGGNPLRETARVVQTVRVHSSNLLPIG